LCTPNQSQRKLPDCKKAKQAKGNPYTEEIGDRNGGKSAKNVVERVIRATVGIVLGRRPYSGIKTVLQVSAKVSH